jgi:hypothetical protein
MRPLRPSERIQPNTGSSGADFVVEEKAGAGLSRILVEIKKIAGKQD